MERCKVELQTIDLQARAVLKETDSTCLFHFYAAGDNKYARQKEKAHLLRDEVTR